MVDVPPPVTRHRTSRAVELDVRNNSLNLVRLVLALLVLVAHGYYLSGEGTGPTLRGENLGGWAVFGFFTISGYLITASRFANGFLRYLLLRAARIYPAFLVCLVVTAGVFAPVAWWAEHGSLGGFISTPTSPLAYVTGNALLRMTAFDVAGTPAAVPYPGAWNGSLWTLAYEFACYLVIGLLILLPAVRRHRWLVGVAFVASVAVWANAPALGLSQHPEIELMARLLPPFLGGALVQTAIRRVPLRAPLALLAAAGAVSAVLLVDRWGAQAAAPLFTYGILWLSTVLPSPAVIRRHDISYGAYIYAFPVQQLLAYAGVHRLGVLAYDVVGALATAVLATLSWRLVERPTMRRARRWRVPTDDGSGASEGVPGEDRHGTPTAAEHRSGQQGQRVGARGEPGPGRSPGAAPAEGADLVGGDGEVGSLVGEPAPVEQPRR